MVVYYSKKRYNGNYENIIMDIETPIDPTSFTGEIFDINPEYVDWFIHKAGVIEQTNYDNCYEVLACNINGSNLFKNLEKFNITELPNVKNINDINLLRRKEKINKIRNGRT